MIQLIAIERITNVFANKKVCFVHLKWRLFSVSIFSLIDIYNNIIPLMLKFEINDKMNKITKKNISDFKKINTYVNKFLDNKNAYLYEVTIIDSKKIKNLNAIYRGINEQTDVLSFCLLNDNSNNKKLLGEIYIAYDYATKEAKKHH
jgi:hypothetical protein